MILNRNKIILASGSPRRLELLKGMGFDVEAVKVDADETYPQNLGVYEIAEFIANKKMDAFYENQKGDKTGAIIVAADTIVVKNGVVLGKPENLGQASEYLELLSNSKHEVITGVCIGFRKHKESFSDISEVYFDELAAEEIKYYINNFEVLDKAGAYAIQEWIGISKISKIVGSYTNIVGLPSQKVYRKLKDFIEKINYK